MAVQSAQVSVGTTATALSVAETDDRGGMSLAVQNTDPAVDMFIGPSDLTTATGFKVTAATTVTVDLQPGETLYGIVASGTVTAHVLRTSV